MARGRMRGLEGPTKKASCKRVLSQGRNEEWRFFSIDLLEWDLEEERWVGNWQDGLSTALITCPLVTALFCSMPSTQATRSTWQMPHCQSRPHLGCKQTSTKTTSFSIPTKVKQMRAKDLNLEPEPDEELDPATWLRRGRSHSFLICTCKNEEQN